jgi:hypothetical protein
MSRESVQFVEMVRNAAKSVELNRGDAECAERKELYRMYCEGCGMADHELVSEGSWELYRCELCGREKWYRVR